MDIYEINELIEDYKNEIKIHPVFTSEQICSLLERIVKLEEKVDKFENQRRQLADLVIGCENCGNRDLTVLENRGLCDYCI